MAGLVACGPADSLDTGEGVDAATYVAVIGRFLPAPTNPEQLRVAYVAGVADAVLSLEDQVAVIEAFAATHDVRFIDDFAAGVDPGLPGSPPRDDGVLIGVGKITGDSPHTVRVEVYIDADRIEAQLVTVSYREGAWVIDSVEPVEPEVLVGDE